MSFVIRLFNIISNPIVYSGSFMSITFPNTLKKLYANKRDDKLSNKFEITY